MSRDTMESAVRAFYEAFNRKDIAAIERLVTPDLVIEETPGFNPNAGIYEGWDSARRYLEGWFKFWESVRSEVVDIAFVDESQVSVAVRVTVLGRESSLEITDDWGHVVEMRDDKVVRATLYRTPQEALETARGN